MLFPFVKRGFGFNGAASCGTRKGEQQAQLDDDDDRASMGPRLVGRGKVRAVARKFPNRELQWGRVLWDAERPPVQKQ